MNLEIEATYENGVLKVDQPLPLENGQRVRLRLQTPDDWVEQSYGLCGWKGNPDELRRLALAPDLDLEEDS